VADPLTAAGDAAPARSRAELCEWFEAVRAFTLLLCEPLAVEDYVLQNMPDVSPTKWHLAHTTWFFERFILREHAAGYEAWHPHYDFLFNSYYNAVGEMHARPQRGQLSRPTVAEVIRYREAVEARLQGFLSDCDAPTFARVAPLLTLGCHHEQQHQELILTDLKYNLHCNPLLPAYHEAPKAVTAVSDARPTWLHFDGGIREIGHAGGGFCFDNEEPRHEILLRPFVLSSQLVSNGEFLEFVEARGYERPELWLDLGYAGVRAQRRRHPLYWYRQAGAWMQYTLGGPVPLELAEPVCHVSFFEADAFARFAGHRLPTEGEWETAAADQPLDGNLAERRRFHVEPASRGGGVLSQIYGDVWEWTASPYTGYPGYRPPAGAIGEYNGKFMCNQYVLRGGSCATSRSHLRPSYRNFFPPEAQWQFSGIRLAGDA